MFLASRTDYDYNSKGSSVCILNFEPDICAKKLCESDYCWHVGDIDIVC